MPNGITELTASVASGYFARNEIQPTMIGQVIREIYQSLSGIDSPAPIPEPRPLTPAVPIRKSVSPEAVTCLECGYRGKMLRRHLRSAHGLTPEQYRERWELPASHPITAPNYAEKRRELAHKIGIGCKPKGR
jgi:predicted transcriptional regulator